ncbi:MAG: transposase [Candidatus Omnitrophota bacterium]
MAIKLLELTIVRLFGNKYRVDTLRLKGWDYSSNGIYFATICTRYRFRYFGGIINGEIKLSGLGAIAQQCWANIPVHFKNVTLDEYIVMPDHIHGMIIIDNNKQCDHANDCRGAGCGANNDHNNKQCDHANDCRGAINRASTPNETGKHKIGGVTGRSNPVLSKHSLPKIIRWFKGRCSFEIRNVVGIKDFSWQSGYYDRIIRNDKERDRVRRYIMNNPLNNDR